MRRARLIAVPLIVSSLLLAGCGGDKKKTEEPESESPTSAATSEPAPEPKTWPLTGEVLEGKAPKHPVWVTKIDNTGGAAPQVGLSQADLVVEELVEGGMTRLAVFFYSKMPELVGPVRSMRASDIGIVTPVGARVITSGAAGPTIARVREAGIQFVQEGSKGFFRESGRSAPYNLMANAAEVAKGTKPDKKIKPYFEFGDAADLPKGKKATSLAASFGGRTSQWTYAKGTYDNTNSYAAQGDKFDADTVLVMAVEIGDAGYRDPGGNFVPESKFLGKGPATLFHGGRVIKATWHKKDHDSQVTLTLKNGDSLHVPTGRTFVELVPAGNGGVTFQK